MRDLTAAVVDEVVANFKAPVIFYEGEFDSGTLRLWSGIGPITWDSKVWTGSGILASVSAIKETAETKAVGMVATLSGATANIRSLALSEARRGQLCKVWLGFVDNQLNVIANPYKSFEGRLDQPEIDRDPENPKVTIKYESRLIDLERARERRFTEEDQKGDYPEDTGFRYVPQTQEWSETWGGS